MKTRTLKVVEKFAAKESSRPALAGVQQFSDSLIATDSYRTIRFTEKIKNINIPESINSFFPKISKNAVEVNLLELHTIAESATKTQKKGMATIEFLNEKIRIRSDGFLDNEITVDVNFSIKHTKIKAEYLYEITKELIKLGFKTILVDQEESSKPFLIVAENEIEKIEFIIMPIKF